MTIYWLTNCVQQLVRLTLWEHGAMLFLLILQVACQAIYWKQISY